MRPGTLALVLVCGAVMANAGVARADDVVPYINVQPANADVALGSGAITGTATFTTIGVAVPDPTVQWQVSTDGGTTWADDTTDPVSTGPTADAGSTSSTLTVTPVSLDQNGTEYRAVFTNEAGSATSDAATLTVGLTAPPIVTQQPANAEVCIGEPAVLTAAAAGVPAPTVQWQVSHSGGWTDDTTDAGATTPTLTVTGLNIGTSQQYRAVFTNSAGSVVTTAASAVLFAPPPTMVVGNPTAQTVTAPASATFTASARWSPICGPLTAQWQVSANGSAFSNVGGPTTFTSNATGTSTSTFSTGPTAVTQSGSQYRAVFSQPNGTATSSAATLTVTPPPVQVTGVLPAQAPSYSIVLISGQGFTGAREVDFGGQKAFFLRATDRLLIALAPPHAAGAVDVTVQAAKGTSVASSTDQFTYLG
jgi:hypothetical protein